jgi:hypothetical protein
MAEHDIYIDTDRAVAVTSAEDSSQKPLPKFVQGDTMLLRIWLLKGYNRAAEYEPIPTEGLTLQVALGTRVGNSTTYYTQQFTWTASPDAAQPYFEAELPMNTAAITALLGASSFKQAFLEVKYIRSGLPTTVLSEQITIYAAVIKEGGITEPAIPTPLSVESAILLFLQREITGPIYFINETTGLKLKVYATADNPPALAVDPVL